MKRSSIFNRFVILSIILFMVGAKGQEDIDSIMRAEEEAMRQIMDKDQAYKDRLEDLFTQYNEAVTEAYNEYEALEAQRLKAMEDAIRKKWSDMRLDSREEMVDYDDDLNARSSVNFKEGTVEVEVIAEKDDATSQAAAAQKLRQRLAQMTEKQSPDDKPLLKNQLRSADGQKVDRHNAKQFAQQAVESRPIQKKTYRAADGKQRVKYSVQVKMVPNHIEERARAFKSEVLKQSKRFDIDPRVTFAVMHTESYFNPRARSHVPAYGLMQLVPRSGARDAYLYVYKKDRLLKANYLYIPQNNIELGCADIDKIRHVYFSDIQDEKKAYYCAICAYNTGPGNVARALTGTTKLKATAEVANKHSAEWVYNKLLKNLPYEETRRYIKTVTERIGIYEAWL